jgi:hypothetical protein
MSKGPSPLLGYNNNVRHRGKVFHIQTEDSGVARPHIITHLFMDGGRILKSVKTSYAEQVGTPDMVETVRRMMKEQHKAMFTALREGAFDPVIEGATSLRPPAPKAPSAAPKAKAPSVAPKAPSVAPKAPSVAPKAPSVAPAKKRSTAPPPPIMPMAPRVPDMASLEPPTDREPEATDPMAVPPVAPPPDFALEPQARARLAEDPVRLSDLPPPPPSVLHHRKPAEPLARHHDPRAEPDSSGNMKVAKPADPRAEPDSSSETRAAKPVADRRVDRVELPAERPRTRPPPRASSRPPPAAAAKPGSQPPSSQRYSPARPPAIFSRSRPQSNIFGEDLISDKSLDEVILSYLAEDLEGEK